MSSDEAAWGLLENSVTEFVLAQHIHDLSEKEEMLDSEAPLDLAEVSTVILFWMMDLVADYLHGVRYEKVSAIRDVTGCTVRDACFHLGVWNWEEEIALCSYSAANALLTADNVDRSSQGAKLPQSLVECPICHLQYGGEVNTCVLPCCSQVICKSCALKLRNRCPFCRGTSECEVPLNTHEFPNPLCVLHVLGRAAGVGVALGGALFGRYSEQVQEQAEEIA